MQRYQQLFSRLAAAKQGAFMPFVTMGDPGLELSFEIIKTLIDAGADALELGIPFSDPIADGPVIQNANIRALAAGVTPAQCFELIGRIRQYNKDIPIGLLLYSNLVMARGIDSFYQQAQQAGFAAAFIATHPAHARGPSESQVLKWAIRDVLSCELKMRCTRHRLIVRKTNTSSAVYRLG